MAAFMLAWCFMYCFLLLTKLVDFLLGACHIRDAALGLAGAATLQERVVALLADVRVEAELRRELAGALGAVG